MREKNRDSACTHQLQRFQVCNFKHRASSPWRGFAQGSKVRVAPADQSHQLAAHVFLLQRIELILEVCLLRLAPARPECAALPALRRISGADRSDPSVPALARAPWRLSGMPLSGR